MKKFKKFLYHFCQFQKKFEEISTMFEKILEILFKIHQNFEENME